MSIPASAHRSSDRSERFIVRCSPSDKAKLKQRAKEQGISVQTLFDRELLGKIDAQDRISGRRAQQHEELPMTG